MRRHLTAEEASRAIGFLQTGLSQRQVGAQFNVSHTVIRRLWTRYQQTNSVQRRYDVHPSWQDAWQIEDGNYGGVQLMEVVQQVF
jgi:transposase